MEKTEEKNWTWFERVIDKVRVQIWKGATLKTKKSIHSVWNYLEFSREKKLNVKLVVV